MIDIFLTIFLFVGQGDFHDLLDEVEFSRLNAFAEGSYSNLRTQMRSYFSYCVYFGRQPLPADPKTIYGFVQFLTRSLVPSSVRNYLSGVRVMHILHGLPFPHSEDFLLKLELRGIARLDPHVPVRATPVTPRILLTFHHNMNADDSLHLTVWACSLVWFFTMARLGSILPKAKSTPLHTFLTSSRVNFSKQGLVVTLLHTKTIQFGRRRLHIPLVRNDSALCPVQAYEKALMAFDVSQEGPAFMFLDKGRPTWLTGTIFINTFRKVVKAGGVENSRDFTGHSFRRGGATWAFQVGIPGELIQICGDWVSDAYKQYLEFSMDDKLDLAAHMARHLPVL